MSSRGPEARRLWFSTGEDSYFLVYNTSVLLSVLGCHGGRTFRDHRKLSLLVEFVADSTLVSVLERYAERRVSNHLDRQRLQTANLTGLTRVHWFSRLTYLLVQRGLVNLKREGPLLHLSLPEAGALTRLANGSLYRQERQNAERLRRSVRRLNRLSLDLMLRRIFDSRGLPTWVE